MHTHTLLLPAPTQELLSVLVAAGASNISFNPMTPLNTAKALQAVAAAEGLPLEQTVADGIAAAAAGDLRAALHSLQLRLQQPGAAQRAGGQGSKRVRTRAFAARIAVGIPAA
jgi:hypothetical protein